MNATIANYQISKYGFIQSDINEIAMCYNQPHRFYHNFDHITDLFKRANGYNIEMTEDLFLAIILHDIVYDPMLNDNEEQSAILAKNKYDASDEVVNAILETKHHEPQSDLGKLLCKLDLDVLYGSMEDFIEFEHKIFKEYQFVDLHTYKMERIKILSNLGVRDELIQYVQNRHYNIGVYAGSFDPFHIGHQNILEKAEDIFDKVIIAKGFNPVKSYSKFIPPGNLRYRQVDSYNGLLTDYLSSLGYPVTLIRGLRNSSDLEYEKTQQRYMQDLNPNIKSIMVLCDKELEHISSSYIKQLQSYGDAYKQYIPKS